MRGEAADHPLIRAIMEAFPGARIDSVHDSTVDDYGLPERPADVLARVSRHARFRPARCRIFR